MLGVKKRAKKTIGAVKGFYAFKPPKNQRTKASAVPPVTPEPKQEKNHEDDDSEQFDPELVRGSLVENDAMDQYSLDDSIGNSESSGEGSMYTEEEKAMMLRNHQFARKFPREVVVEQNHSAVNLPTDDDDDDDIYIDDTESSQEGCQPEIYERSDDDSGEGEEEDAFDTNNLSNVRKQSRNPLATGGPGVTDSVIAYTTGSSLAVSINQIDKMMETREPPSIQDPHAPPQVEHEDGTDVLTKLELALRFSIVSAGDGHSEVAKELNSELELEILEAELNESRIKTVNLEEKLNNSKAKMLEMHEVGEQVHMARGFALQSMKLKDFALENHGSSARLQTTRPGGSSADDVVIREEELSDESDEDAEYLDDIVVVEDDDELSENDEQDPFKPNEARSGAVVNTSEQVDEAPQTKHMCPPTVPDAYLDSVRGSDECFSPYDDELSQAVEDAMEVATKEYDFNQEDDFRVSTLEHTSRADSEAGKASPDAKLRTSLQRARQMEEVGEQVRQDRFQQAGETELEVRPIIDSLRNDDFDLRKSSQNSEIQSAEIFELRASLQEQLLQIENLERDRGYNASKVAELTSVIQRSGTDDLLQHLTEKSIEVAELRHEVAILREELNRAADRRTVLEAERDANKTVIANLSASLWKKDPLGSSTIGGHDAVHELMKQGGVIPENDALGMTIARLQTKIEALEDERAAYKETVETLTASVSELTEDNDAKMRQIAALESQFLMLNRRGQSTSVVLAAHPLGSPKTQQNQEKLLRFKTWANNKINQAHEQFENIKSDIEIRRDVTNPDQVLT